MGSSSGPLAEILSELDEVAAGQHWDRADTELDLLNEEIVEALIERRDDDIRLAAERVERLYSRLAVRLDDGTPSSMETMVCGRLKGLSGLLIVAMRHRRAPTADAVLSDQSSRRILEALNRGEHSTRALAQSVELREETVARKLPQLRAAGLVHSWKAGRSMMNTLTEAGQNLLASKRGLSAPQGEHFVKAQPTDEEFVFLPVMRRKASLWLQAQLKMRDSNNKEGGVACTVGESGGASGTVRFLKIGRGIGELEEINADETKRRFAEYTRQRELRANAELDGNSPSTLDVLSAALKNAHRNAGG